MPSSRKVLENNKNGSKATRMQVSEALARCDYRKDELMHIGRYIKAGDTMVRLARVLKRPVRVLDIGCGEIYAARTLYKSFVEDKKSDVIQHYCGVDIDAPMLEETRERHHLALKACSGELIVQDLTQSPTICQSDGYFDLILCFEMIEHIETQFVKPIMVEARRLLSNRGVFLLSTPNGDISQQLPVDHIYEWGYDELFSLLVSIFDVKSTVGTCVNISKVPKNLLPDETYIEAVYTAFGRVTSMASVALAPLIPARYCKNVLWELV